MAADTFTDRGADEFEAHRSLLTGVAYRMLGSLADAEDVVQEAWLRWTGSDRSEVREVRAYLVRITTRLAIDRLRHLQSRREAYVGPWLPEPIATGFAGPGTAAAEATADGAERAVLAESVSLAFLVVLESLSPLERAVFVLREAFGFSYAEIAAALDRAEPAVRQLGMRARKHVDARKPRFDVDPVQRRKLTEGFLAAAGGGDLAGLMELLAPDACLVADSGGKTRAPKRIIESADKVGRFLLGVAERPVPDMSYRFVELNGGPAVVLLSAGKPDTVFQVDIREGRIQSVYILRNPDKLALIVV
ncbi:RNA polymerase sigma-70 factor [Streptomyces bambusae]|uniref:RNA polymerase sigma-70 factor n=1 Tax=Streptomyces bambusae TaxID=1550616 RepID=UPI001CFF7D11|nr:RNA polymerase sigma-70 factor [Streptomyces bambusae]MCB5169398.1 RNA polymerase sigma-70 factor [Streptomyces bambusae]